MSDTICIPINISDGWVAVATNPLGLNIKSEGIGRWHFAAVVGDEAPDIEDEDFTGETYEGISSRYVPSFVGIIYVRADTDDHPFSITADMGAVHTVQSNGVPNGFDGMTSNTIKKTISRGQKTRVSMYPRIINEHAESAREVQGVISNGNIVGQVWRASKDNITALMLTLESAAGILVDDFESYANSAALQAAWIASGALASLETIIVNRGTQSMSLPTTNTGDEWIVTAIPADYTGYTGIFAGYFSHAFSQQQISVFIGDGTNTKSFVLPQDNAGSWQSFEVNEVAMIEDQVGITDVGAITVIGYRVVLKRTGGAVFIDDLFSVPPPGSIDIKLWDMGEQFPVSGKTSIDDGDQYDQIGDAHAASYNLQLDGGERLYHIEEFFCGAEKSIPTNKLIKIDNYYLIELIWVDTDVNVYGPDPSLGIDYYNSGFAFTAADEATPISAIGEFSNLMFAILSTQDVYIVEVSWRFDADPGGESQMAVFAEDNNMQISGVVVDHEHSPEAEFTADLRFRPMLLVDGGKLEYYFNDDPRDLVTFINTEMQILCEAPTLHG